MRQTYNFVDAQRLLIKPFERPRFILFFIIGSLLSEIIALGIINHPNVNQLGQETPILYRIVTGIVSGTLLGATQWLVLRKYIPDWKWILVVALNLTLLSSVQAIITQWLQSLFDSSPLPGFPQPSVPVQIILSFTFLSTSVGMLIYGYLQWYIIQPYVAKARWWLCFPFLIVLAGSMAYGLYFWLIMSPIHSFISYIPPIKRQFIAATFLPAALSLGFCTLKTKSKKEHPMLESKLAAAPDIINYWKIRDLGKSLYLNISRLWKTELTPEIPQLGYLVGVDPNHSMLAYEPMDQTSADHINETPLPELLGSQPQASLENRLAKFQVVFTPPGSVRVISMRGIPLLWLGVATFATIFGLSVALSFLIGMLPWTWL